MILENSEYYAQIKRTVEESNVPWEKLFGKSVMISGAAGMLGSAATDILIYLNEEKNAGITVYALGRTEKKLKERYGFYADKPYFNIVTADVIAGFDFDFDTDYIMHAASNANPYMYANFPVDTLLGNVLGADNFLKYGKDHGMKRFLYVSSGEMYGQPDDSVTDGFTEDYCGKVNYSDARSCYPSGKRAAETLCQSYISQYDMEAVIVRPCHCYGPTQSATDNRAISDFIRKAANGEDIVLKSDGSLERTHCYCLDAAQGMYLVLLCAPNGEAYNIADNRSDASVRVLAETIAKAGGTKVVFDIPNDTDKKGFSKVTRAVLNGDKLRNLGWKPMWNLEEGTLSTVKFLR
ncbi:MAG: NAD-dependent epimerase/dehydratase family protein [Eubacterium sp.]|nr:NAD-dependent epimerase/dehydratase family protein [Eubacterium sp.]